MRRVAGGADRRGAVSLWLRVRGAWTLLFVSLATAAALALPASAIVRRAAPGRYGGTASEQIERIPSVTSASCELRGRGYVDDILAELTRVHAATASTASQPPRTCPTPRWPRHSPREPEDQPAVRADYGGTLTASASARPLQNRRRVEPSGSPWSGLISQMVSPRQFGAPANTRRLASS